MIKSVFIHVIEDKYNLESLCTMQEQSHEQVVSLAKDICLKFKKCIKEKCLPSYFCPEVNLFTDEFGQFVYDLDAFQHTIERMECLLQMS